MVHVNIDMASSTCSYVVKWSSGQVVVVKWSCGQVVVAKWSCGCVANQEQALHVSTY